MSAPPPSSVVAVMLCRTWSCRSADKAVRTHASRCELICRRSFDHMFDQSVVMRPGAHTCARRSLHRRHEVLSPQEALAIPRGQVALAAGSANPDATEFEVSAAVGAETFGILSNPFLD